MSKELSANNRRTSVSKGLATSDRRISMPKLLAATGRPTATEQVFIDRETIGAEFTIMNNTTVREEFHLKDFTVREREISVVFDRTYQSSMEASPSHLTMTVLPLLAQRSGYAYFCYHWGLPYRPNEPELFKIWPTTMSIDYPVLYRNEKDLKFTTRFTKLEDVSDTRTNWAVSCDVDGKMKFTATGTTVRLG